MPPTIKQRCQSGEITATVAINLLEEENATMRRMIGASLEDSERIDWLIEQGPPGAAEGAGLNMETWDLATAMLDDSGEDTDAKVVRRAIDAARKK